jgi:hypothetical protein
MKSIATLILMLALSASAFGQKNKEVPVYQTGTIQVEVFHYDSSASVTVGNRTYFAGCNASDTSVSCSDATGVTYLKLADGTKMFEPNWMSDDAVQNGNRGGCFASSVPFPIHGGNGETFKYRIMHIQPRLCARQRSVKEGDFLCIPYVNDKGKTLEACTEFKPQEIASLPKP